MIVDVVKIQIDIISNCGQLGKNHVEDLTNCVTPIRMALLKVIYWGGYLPHCFLSNRCDDDIGGFNQIPVSELHIAAISETPVIPTQHETLCLP